MLCVYVRSNKLANDFCHKSLYYMYQDLHSKRDTDCKGGRGRGLSGLQA